MKKIYILLFMTLCTLCASAAVETLADGIHVGTYKFEAISALSGYTNANKNIKCSTEGTTQTIVFENYKVPYTGSSAINFTFKVNTSDNKVTVSSQKSGWTSSNYGEISVGARSGMTSYYIPEIGVFALGLEYTYINASSNNSTYAYGYDYIELVSDAWTAWEPYPSEGNNSATWNINENCIYWKDSTSVKNADVRLYIRESTTNPTVKQVKVTGYTLGIKNAKKADVIFDWNTSTGEITMVDQYINYYSTYSKEDKTYGNCAKMKCEGKGSFNPETGVFTLPMKYLKNGTRYGAVNETIVLPSFDLAVSSAGWASMYIDYPVLVPEGATAYYASSISSSSIHLTPIEAGSVIPVKTGVIVSASEGTHKFVASAETPVEVTNNLFGGVLTSAKVSSPIYVLSPTSTPSRPVFSKYTSETLGANKVYLFESKIPSSGKFEFVFDEPTGIETVNNAPFISSNAIYNLQGMKVDNNYKGVIVVNGKKFVNK